MANKLIVSLSPHVHSGDSVQKNMYGVIIALVPALLVSFYMFGLGGCHCHVDFSRFEVAYVAESYYGDKAEISIGSKNKRKRI